MVGVGYGGERYLRRGLLASTVTRSAGSRELVLDKLRDRLADLQKAAVRIAEEVANLSGPVDRWGWELSAPGLEYLVGRLAVRHPNGHSSWSTVVRSGGGAKVTPGLYSVGSPLLPAVSNCHGS
jgi:hypothetical protein